VKNLNAVFSKLEVRRRYEVWFLRLGLADGSGAWWFRYLLMNPGGSGCAGNAAGMPVQVWATWFPQQGKPCSFIQGFALERLQLSPRGEIPFHFRINENKIGEDSCSGRLAVDGHTISWNLRYRSTAHVTLSDKGWIGFSRSPHSDATFSGEIDFDGQHFGGEPLGWGVQGHNCGYRHRNQWTWTHACFPLAADRISSFEALTYEMPLGLKFRKAVLWHQDKLYIFRQFREQTRDRDQLKWIFTAQGKGGNQIEVSIDGTGESLHRLPYLKTDCSGRFEVANNSLAQARIIARIDNATEEFNTNNGAVLEMTG
jgi:hypothetical protein